ncbi:MULTISPECIES: DUF5655 domain-containing protein [Bacillus]|uniref:DUF5655 domain-containing protein n=1 Tax=Bacillus TaxID=1386 RepID=UPI001072A167|nr:DUF5655 domain-containing protein [Bacillus subtilis]MBU8614208.1 hypothetical protein [Bacillus subtilis]MBU8720177.1 hypothetical protein [Bacillus subtilis]MEC4032712.1 DUF5655 domain-containing protein [Bacillus subtilis]TWG53419.1 putative transport protein [Bacillus subtilis J23]TWG67145.1 putative transport protein [Bacillus subtilis J25]
MYLYKVNNQNQLEDIREKPFKKEKEIQDLFETNLQQMLGLSFVKSEFRISNFRIDTLAFDAETKSFVIIEYKNTKNFSVVDQGYAYLAAMLNHKADFILEYNENHDRPLKRDDVDWSQSKVIFISPVFTVYQKQSIHFKDLPIELWEIKRYENDLIQLNQMKADGVSESIKTISQQSETIQEVSKEIKVFSEEDHLADKPFDIIELYQQLKEFIFNLDDHISIKPTKLYIAFTSNKRNFTDILLLKSGLKLWVNMKKGELHDPEKRMRDVSKTGHWGNGDYEIFIKDDENIEYIMGLIKQSYEKNK